MKYKNIAYIDTAALADNYRAVAEKAGGAQAKTEVMNATDALLEGKGDYEKGQIQSRINMTDWSNQESLLSLQLALEQQYGYTEEEAKNYVEVLGQAAFATSSLTTTV